MLQSIGEAIHRLEALFCTKKTESKTAKPNKIIKGVTTVYLNLMTPILAVFNVQRKRKVRAKITPSSLLLKSIKGEILGRKNKGMRKKYKVERVKNSFEIEPNI